MAKVTTNFNRCYNRNSTDKCFGKSGPDICAQMGVNVF